MRNSGNNDALDVGENFLERNCAFRRNRIQLREDCSRLGVRRDGARRDLLAVICNPIGYLMKMLAKNIRRDIAEFRSKIVRGLLHPFIFYGSGLWPTHLLRVAMCQQSVISRRNVQLID